MRRKFLAIVASATVLMMGMWATPVSAQQHCVAFPDVPMTTSLCNVFLDYWEANGGLPVFGYPLTEEMTEGGLTVQYLERQRFEHHPNNAGTDYEVLFGLLGNEEVVYRGLTDHPAFQAHARTGEPAMYENGHNVGKLFADYWSSHGLDFGENGAGYSFRESLALFGYPISELYFDEELGLNVQYFERARFEHHPNNAEPYDVLLGRLAAEKLDRGGNNGERPDEPTTDGPGSSLDQCTTNVVAGYEICYVTSNGEVTVSGNSFTFTQLHADEAAIGIIVRQNPNGVGGIQFRTDNYGQVLFYVDENDRRIICQEVEGDCRANRDGQIGLILPENGDLAFYVGSTGLAGDQTTFHFVAPDQLHGLVIDTQFYALN